MSDEDGDYNTSEDSEDELPQKKPTTSLVKEPGPSKPGLLSLVDNDNEYDSSIFHRPDLLGYRGGDCGESDEELSGESDVESDFGNKKRLKKSKTLTGKSNNRNSKFSYNSDQDELKKSQSAKKGKKKKQIGICVVATKYDCVRRVGRKLGFKEVEEHEDWSVFWTDLSVSIDRVNQMKRWQVSWLLFFVCVLNLI